MTSHTDSDMQAADCPLCNHAPYDPALPCPACADEIEAEITFPAEPVPHLVPKPQTNTLLPKPPAFNKHKKRITHTLDNVQLAIRHLQDTDHVRLGYDSFMHKHTYWVRWADQQPHTSQPTKTDTMTTELRTVMAADWKVHFSHSEVQRVVNRQVENRTFSSLAQEIEALPEWDGTPRLRTLAYSLMPYANDAPRDLYHVQLFNFFNAMLARALRPGCHYPQTLIYVGTKNLGKDGHWRDWTGGTIEKPRVVDSLTPTTIRDTNFNAMRLCQEKTAKNWIILVRDMSSTMNPDTCELFKRFIDKQDYNSRAAYGGQDDNHEFPSHCVIACSSNHSGFLSPQDDVWRRPMIQPVIAKFPFAYIKEHRDQMFAEIKAQGVWKKHDLGIDATWNRELFGDCDWYQMNLDHNQLFVTTDDYDDAVAELFLDLDGYVGKLQAIRMYKRQFDRSLQVSEKPAFFAAMRQAGFIGGDPQDRIQIKGLGNKLIRARQGQPFTQEALQDLFHEHASTE